MTPRERAKALTECRHTDLLVYEIEKAIKAAIEEDRRSRECCKAEREACALIAAEEMIHWAFEPRKTGEHFKHIAEVIRARSN